MGKVHSIQYMDDLHAIRCCDSHRCRPSRAGFPQGVSNNVSIRSSGTRKHQNCEPRRNAITGGDAFRFHESTELSKISNRLYTCPTTSGKIVPEARKTPEEPRPSSCCDILNITVNTGVDPELSPKSILLFTNHPYRFPQRLSTHQLRQAIANPFRNRDASL
jgi:hypothetical protein